MENMQFRYIVVFCLHPQNLWWDHLFSWSHSQPHMCLPKLVQCNVRSLALSKWPGRKTLQPLGWYLWPRKIILHQSGISKFHCIKIFEDAIFVICSSTLTDLVVPILNHLTCWFIYCLIFQVASPLHSPILSNLKSPKMSILVVRILVTLINPSNKW